MAPFLVSHPLLLDAWMQVRETTLPRVRSIEELTPEDQARLQVLARRVTAHLVEWSVSDPEAMARIEGLKRDWPRLMAGFGAEAMGRPYAIDQLIEDSRRYGVDLEELGVTYVIEPFGELVDGLTECMASPFRLWLDPTMPVLQDALMRDLDWALALDYEAAEQSARFWYMSEEKLEPRLGHRYGEAVAERESPLGTARQVQALARDLDGYDGRLHRFLATHPQHRSAVRRVQTVMHYPYAEVRDNLIAETIRPIDMLRCKLAFVGAACFDPKSDLWTRITLAQGAPLFDELERAGDWWFPTFGAL